jgi:hypothetical protein
MKWDTINKMKYQPKKEPPKKKRATPKGYEVILPSYVTSYVASYIKEDE